jgi:hypothetical protein
MGSSELLSHDGTFKFTIKNAKSGKSKSGNDKLTVVLVCEDEDNKGRQLIKDVAAGGNDKNGKPLVRQLGDLLLAQGTGVEKIRAIGAQGSIDLDALAQQLTGRAVFATVSADTYEGKTRSQIDNFVPVERYDADKAVGAHRKPHAVTGTIAAPTGAIAASSGAPKNGAEKIMSLL